MVTAWGNIVLSNKGTITGALQISGLPFVADSTPSHGHVFVSFWLNWGTAFVYLSGSIAASTSVATIIAAAAAATGLSGLTTSDVTNTTQITFVAHYMTAS
jgi:hypothetical protein